MILLLLLFTVLVDASSHSVILMRHCNRAPPTSWVLVGPFPEDANQYAQDPWPAFPVSPYQCTPRGLQIIENQGKNMNKTLPGKVRVFYDDNERDRDTAVALARGIGLSASELIPASSLFDPVGAGVCAAVPVAEVTAAMEELLDHLPRPERFEYLHEQLQNILGAGNVNISELSDVVHDGEFYGASFASYCAVENFLLQEGAGVNMAWDKCPVQLMRDLQALYVYWLTVAVKADVAARNKGSNLLMHMLTSLQSFPGTSIYVGHDSDLARMQTLLNMSWTPSPFPINLTHTGSFLRMDHTDGKPSAQASFGYTLFDTDAGLVHTVPAIFRHTGTNSYTMDDLVNNVRNHDIDPACVEDTHPRHV